MNKETIKYLILDELGTDLELDLHDNLSEAEESAQYYVEEHGGSVYICRVTPAIKMTRRGVTKEEI